MKNRFILFVLICLHLSCDNGRDLRVIPSMPDYRIMFWNTENFFDYRDDSIAGDDEFLPDGIRHWTKERYRKKLLNVYRVIVAAGVQRPPEIIGLCEIENGKVLSELLYDTPFSFFRYRLIHHDSPDRRGIDVAFLYDPERVEIIGEYAINVNIREGGGNTRDILYVRTILEADTVSFFINHWPSKYGGSGLTEKLRQLAAMELRNAVEQVIVKSPDEKVVIMGDFNDPPGSSSISDHLGAVSNAAGRNNVFLHNMSAISKGSVYGSYKYEGLWEMIDQFFVNGNCYHDSSGITSDPSLFHVFSPDFILENDETYGGKKPSRTYSGMIYNGGFSDHLPVTLDLVSEREYPAR